MSQENVELVLSMYDAFRRRDNEAPFEVYADDILWEVSTIHLPDLDPSYRGHAGVKRFWRTWLSAWEAINFEILDVIDLGDHVIVEIDQCQRGRKSGVETNIHWFQAWTIHDGKVAAARYVPTKQEAYQAIGLTD